LWPPQPPDLNPWAIYLWGTLKEKLYVKNLLCLEELQENIRHEISVLPYSTSDVGLEYFPWCKASLGEDRCYIKMFL
jgi:hypothetical protein